MMERSPSFPRPHPLGHVIETLEVTVFFGNRHSHIHELETTFPDYHFAELKQFHSDIVVHARDTLHRDGDAHITRNPKLALCIKTADCIPVMIHDPESGWAAAIHAGWRGIENEIILKTCDLLRGMSPSLKKARAWIGPHIRVDSFEVGRDVADRLQHRFEAVRGFSRCESVVCAHPDPSKVYVDLSTIARAQLASRGIGPERVIELEIDTVTSEEHCSYRRDRESSNRQISFIALK